MRKLLLSSAIFAAVASVSFTGQAADTATLGITGKITPAACNVSLSAASIDLGNIPASTLTDQANIKKGDDVVLSVNCDTASATAIQTTDNRASSAMTISEMAEQMGMGIGQGYTDAYVFGLGNDSAQSKIGALTLGISSATADGAADSNVLVSTDKATWGASALKSPSGTPLERDAYFALASDADTTAPAALTTSTYTITSGILLKKGSSYPSGEEVNIDGNVTFSVVYL